MVLKPVNTAAISDAAIASAATDGVGAMRDEIVVGITPEGTAHASYVNLTESSSTEYISLTNPVNGTAISSRGQPITTKSFRSVRSNSFLGTEKITSTMDIVRRRWGELGPVSDGTIVAPEAAKETMAILNRFPGLLEANPSLSEEELIGLFDNFIHADNTLAGNSSVPGINSLISLTWGELMNPKAMFRRVNGYINETARVSALLVAGRKIMGVGVEMPAIKIKAWSTHINRCDGKIRPKMQTLKPEVDVIEFGGRAIEIKQASFTRSEKLIYYILRLLEQGSSPEQPVELSNASEMTRRTAFTAIRFVNQLLYYKELLRISPLKMIEYDITAPKRPMPTLIASAAYAFMGEENFRIIQYDDMFSSEGAEI